jgi:RNA polymerase sigma-70 factor, ECF subfamily
VELDTDDIERFLDENADWVLRLATVLTRTRQDGEDLAQEVLIRAIRHLPKVKDARAPRAYLRRMIVNENIRRAKPGVRLLEEFPSHGHLEAGYARFEAATEADRLLATLSPRHAAAVALRYLEGCEYSEIAAALRCREATARSGDP